MSEIKMDKTLLVTFAIVLVMAHAAASRKCFYFNYASKCLNSSNCSHVMTCESTSNYCYSLHEIRHHGQTQVRLKGCWQPSVYASCLDHRKCQLRPQKSHPRFLFCCCSRDLCNSNNNTQIKLTLDQFSDSCALDKL
ncbi:PREDICTED: uncharacterized protein LOC107339190 [Acropora digitifera]|uniref:uncharacterized protein LOC107339190 n=1 Tax=Acropora digitifera TaxID=70779 RepID=UPI00077A4A75|nr:PREDICTED: uncharacterized protein LOC107339190 [Acropora digitifera]